MSPKTCDSDPAAAGGYIFVRAPDAKGFWCGAFGKGGGIV